MMRNSFCKVLFNLLASLFYVGYIPLIPGTLASMVTAVTLFFLPTISAKYFIGGLFILFFVGVFIAKHVAVFYKKHDPSYIVIDEVLGMSVSLFMVPKVWWFYCISFLLFRFFDIYKPFWISKVEKISWGWGIMLDDLVAGLFTLGVVSFIGLFIGF